jgi:CRP-like cAMP-binding protein
MNRSATGSVVERRLLSITHLSAEETVGLRALAGKRHQAVAGEIIIEQCQPLTGMALIEDGWAIRYRDLENGRRQIMDFLLPGDLCNPCVLIAEQCDFAIAAITPLSYSVISQAQLLELVQHSPRIALLLWWEEAAEADRLRSHLAAVGRMSAYERIAQLLIELWSRLKAIHLAADYSFACPLTQEMIADATGLSTIHVNRVLRRMEREKLIKREGKAWTFIDPGRLQHIAHAPMALQPGRLLRNRSR